jgi:hypothetical protein
MKVIGDTVQEVLEAYFEKNHRARSFLMGQTGRLRSRLAIYVDGVMTADRLGLAEAVHAQADIFIAQLPLDPENEELH